MPTTASRPTPLLLQRFQAVAEETRLTIVHLLGDGERCVCELQDALDASQSRLSFHLKKLKDAGIVADRPQGRWVYYRLVPEVLEEMRWVLGALTPGAPQEMGAEGVRMGAVSVAESDAARGCC